MEKDQELKHVCKFCKKRYPCGRSLGGHIRSHMSNNTSTETKKKLSKRKLSSSVNGEINNNKTHMMGYGLRENPKKTLRFSNSINGTLRQKKVCRVCSKGFKSWKALFGHMRCHSEPQREKIFQSLEDDSWTSEEQIKLVIDTQSDKEIAVPNRKRRTNASSSSSSSSCSSICEIEQEKEEVAMCLMMLSRDVRYWGGLNFVADSSEYNSEVLEAKSLQMDKRIIEKEGKIFVRNVDEVVKMKKPRSKKLELCILNSGDVRFDRKKSEFGGSGSGSGFSRNGIKKAESEVFVDGFIGDDEFKKPKLDYETELEVFDDELGKNFIKEADDALDSPKKSKYKCMTCDKIFHSYQALGGHRASHKKVKGCFVSRIEKSGNSIETDVSPDPTDDSKHECSICFKVFTSGQALGGHKRSHLVGGSEGRANQTIVIQQQLSEIHDLLDLNLPAPSEEDTNGNNGFKPWWVGSNHKRVPLMGLISN